AATTPSPLEHHSLRTDPIHTSPSIPIFLSTAPAPTEIYTLSLHDALPISSRNRCAYTPNRSASGRPSRISRYSRQAWSANATTRSEEHTSELQSHLNLVCRLLLEKKKFTDSAVEVERQRCTCVQLCRASRA